MKFRTIRRMLERPQGRRSKMHVLSVVLIVVLFVVLGISSPTTSVMAFDTPSSSSRFNSINSNNKYQKKFDYGSSERRVLPLLAATNSDSADITTTTLISSRLPYQRRQRPQRRSGRIEGLLLYMGSSYSTDNDTTTEQQQQQQQLTPNNTNPPPKYKYGMPWHTSIAPYTPPPPPHNSHHGNTLLFMPYWEYTVSLLHQQLTNLQSIEDIDPEYAYVVADSSFVPTPAAAAKAAANAKKGTTTTTTPSTKEQSPTPQPKKKSRLTSASYTSDEYRKIRMFYYDGGDAIQAYNSLWYPNPKCGNVPLLGIDLLAFDRTSYLVIIDFQPLPDDLDDVLPPNPSSLSSSSSSSSSREKVRDLWTKGGQTGATQAQRLHERLPLVLQGKMSRRFFDQAEFFSNHMLFGRFRTELESLIYPPPLLDGVGVDGGDVGIGGDGVGFGGDGGGAVFESFQKYLQTHIDMVQSSSSSSSVLSSISSSSTKSNNNNNNNDDDIDKEEILQMQEMMERAVLEGHKKYDVYSASRDPALAMFARVFGEEWADGYIHDYMFDLSTGGGGGVGADRDGVAEAP